jgi:hypothetical protein
MSDGFVVSSEFLSYNPDHGLITAPTSNKVEGSGYVNGDLIEFDSFGFRYNSENKIMNLLSKSNVKSRADTDEWTIVNSDQCEMNNKTKILYFSMSPDSKNYVKTREPKLAVRSKVLELDLGSQNKINYMVATDDVLIRDLTKNDELSYDTCGKAEFKAESDIVRLTIFPQSYRNQDTVTADVILLHRDTDLVEAESTNGVTM